MQFLQATTLMFFTSSATAFKSIGCWTDNLDRALKDKSTDVPSMTTQHCATFCAGYAIFGTEFGNQCYCGNELWNGAAIQDPRTACNKPCGGNADEICGGTWAMNLYIY